MKTKPSTHEDGALLGERRLSRGWSRCPNLNPIINFADSRKREVSFLTARPRAAGCAGRTDPFPQPIVLSENFIAWRWLRLRHGSTTDRVARHRSPAKSPVHGARA